MTKDVQGLEVGIGTVLELEAQKVAVIGQRATAQLDSKSRGEVGCKFRVKSCKKLTNSSRTYECP